MLIGLLLISMIAGISTTFLVGLWLPLGIVGSVFAFGASGATIVLFASLILPLAGQAESDIDALRGAAKQRAAVSA